jgi:hypothetical protein
MCSCRAPPLHEQRVRAEQTFPQEPRESGDEGPLSELMNLQCEHSFRALSCRLASSALSFRQRHLGEEMLEQSWSLTEEELQQLRNPREGWEEGKS